MKIKAGFFLLVLTAISCPTSANDLSVSTICPTRVRVGQPLDIQVRFKNNKCTESVVVNRVMVGLAGNQGGLLKLQGPFSLYLNPPLVVPRAACNDDYGFPTTPGETTRQVTAVNKMPRALAGKVALSYVEALQDNGKGQGGDTCLVEVVY